MRCSYCSFFSITYIVGKNASDKQEQILVIESLTDDTDSISINLYNCNTKNDQLTAFADLKNLLENFDLTKSHLFFDRSVEGKGDNQKVSKKAIAEKGTNY